jgi:hypothetical protein
MEAGASAAAVALVVQTHGPVIGLLGVTLSIDELA